MRRIAFVVEFSLKTQFTCSKDCVVQAGSCRRQMAPPLVDNMQLLMPIGPFMKHILTFDFYLIRTSPVFNFLKAFKAQDHFKF